MSKDAFVGGKTSITKGGNNRFPTAEREVVFFALFKDDDKMWVLEIYMCFFSYLVASCLVSNIILLIDEEKMNAMTYSKLNQFIGGSEYKVRNIDICLFIDIFEFF